MNVWWMEAGVSGAGGDTAPSLVDLASDQEVEHVVIHLHSMEAKTALEQNWRRRNVTSRFVLQ